MKRFISLLTSLVLFLGSLPLTAGADTYVYPEITVVISPSDKAQLEMEFRAWAAELIADYYFGAYSASIDPAGVTYPQPYAEYFRMATTKYNFDISRTGKDKIVYNMYRDGVLEDQKRDAMTMWALKETLKDAVTINNDKIMEEYKLLKNINSPESHLIVAPDPSYLMLDIGTGSLEYNEALEAVDDVENNMAWMAFADLFTSCVLLGVEGYLQVQVEKSGERDVPALRELVDGLDAIIGDTIKQFTEVERKNAQIDAQNAILDMLVADTANQIAFMNKRSAMFFREAYSDSLTFQRDNNDALDAFIDMLDPEKNPSLKSKIIDRAELEVTVQNFYHKIGLIELENIDFEVALTLGVIEAMQGVLKTTLDAVVAQMKESKKTKKIEIGSFEISMSDVVGLLGDTLTETVDTAFERTLNDIYDAYFSGSTGIDAAYCIDKLKENIVSIFTSEEIWLKLGANLIEAFGGIVADKIDTGNVWMDALFKTAVSVSTDSESVAVDQAVKALLGIDRKPTADDILDYISNALDLAGESYKRQYQDTLIKYTKRTNVLHNKELHLDNLNPKKVKKGKIEDVKKSIARTQKDVDDLDAKLSGKIYEVCCDLMDDIFETYADGFKFWDSVSANMNNEGCMSLIAGCIASSRELSFPLTTSAYIDIRDKIVKGGDHDDLISAIQDPSKVSMETLTNLVSVIHTKVKYDISGTMFYYDLSFHTWVMGDYFMNREEDDRVGTYWVGPFAAEFFNYTDQHHININGKRGILKEHQAEALYNLVVIFYDNHFKDTYNPAWDDFFKEANGS